MKKLVLTVLCLFLLSGVCMASPLMNYSKGSVGFDYTYRPNLDLSAGIDVPYSIKSGDYSDSGTLLQQSWDFDGSANLDLGVTIGLGNDWAVQYRQYNPEGQIGVLRSPGGQIGVLSSNGAITFDGKIRSEEFNIMHKLSPNVSAFVGVVRASFGVTIGAHDSSDGGSSLSINLPELRTEERNMFQVGLLGTAPIADKLTGYGTVSFGNDYQNWEAGLSYAIAKNLEFNVSYRDTKWDSLNYASLAVTTPDGYVNGKINAKDLEAKGWGFGLSYKF